MTQTFSITGQLIEIKEPVYREISGKPGTQRAFRYFKIQQHSDERHEGALQFSLPSKHINEVNGFAKGDHVRVFFSIRATPKATFFNAFKIEPADEPVRVARTTNTPIEQTPGFNPHNNTPA